MKTILLGLLISFLIFSGANSQSKWEIVNEGSGLHYWGIDFINAKTGWVFDWNGPHKTNDGGNTWLTDSILSQYEIFEVDFINDIIGWAHGRGIYKTMDGGQTWLNQKSGGGDHPFVKNIYAIDDSSVYVLEESLYKTIDGGTSWVDVTPPGSSDFSNACFLNADTGIVIGINVNGVISLFRTFNGGESWDVRADPGSIDIIDIKFLNDSIGFFLANDQSDYKKFRLYRTTNFFHTWFPISYEQYSIIACHFFDKDRVISVMEDSLCARIMTSEDGGLTWENVGDKTLPVPWNYQFYFFENVGYLICHNLEAGGSLFLRTLNQGKNWDVSDMNYPFKDVFITDENQVFFAGGSYGAHGGYVNLIKTDNTLKNFDFLLGIRTGAKFPDPINCSLQIISDSVGFYADLHLMKTSDGGENWIKDTEFDIVYDLSLINNSIVYVISFKWSYGYGIYKTTNGGISWENFYSPENELNSIFFIDENTGWGLGWSGEHCSLPIGCDGGPTIHKYDEEFGWREIPTEANLPLNKIFFINHDIGWISGGYNNYGEGIPYFLRTEDGGESWSEVSGLNYLINDFHFETVHHGWSVGEDMEGGGVILETFNGGLTWEVVIDSLSGSLRALHIQNGYGLAVGDNGLILKTEYTSTSINRFMVVGDAHHYSPAADFNESMLYELTMAAVEEEVDFIFFTGDLGMRTFDTPEEADSVLKDWRFVLDTLYKHSIRVYACRGNVDAGSREAWDTLFSGIYAFPQNGPEMEKNLSYAIEYDNLLFLALDQYTDSHKINQAWLDSILATSTSGHIFAAGHEPAFKLLNPACMNAFPEERNLFWESLTEAGALTYFSGHDHFYDHTIIDDGDSNPDNDIHQVIVGTGGGSIFSDSEYNGENGRWTPERLFHEEEHGYVLVELNGDEVELTWKHRIEPNVFEFGGDSYTFTKASTSVYEIQIENDVLINYPNPFHSRTIISYQLQASTDVELSIYDLSGRKVSTLIEERQAAGKYDIEWHSEGLKPGIYLCEMRTQKRQQVIKMILLE